MALLTMSAGAQRPGGQGGSMPAQGVVTGRVLDKTTQVVMEYANVVLYSMRDSSVVTGTVTDAAGMFKLENIRPGRFYAIANFIGFEKTYINDIKINPNQWTVDLGTIVLNPATTSLEGVEVVADKARVEYKIDKKVVNVSQDLMASGNSAIAVLENTPSVQVDIEGNVSLRGSSNFTVLIDGRPSVLQGSDALQQIPASSIEQIEIITNPSAKYDPDGVGGIINVVMKKQKKTGMNGVVNASVGTGNKYELDALLNYRTKNFNFFAGLDYNDREFSMDGETRYETYFPDTTNYRNSEMEGLMNRSGFSAKGGFDYYLTDKATLTLSGRYGGYRFGRDRSTNRYVYTIPALNNDYSRSESNSEREGNYYDMNMNYVQKFDDQGHQLEILGFYSRRGGDDYEEQLDYTTDSDWNIIDDVPDAIQTTEKDYDRELRIKADYTKPIGEEGKIEAGYQSRFEFENEKYVYSDFDYLVNDWIENPLYTSEMDFKRNIHSVYGIYGNTWGSFGYQAGLRGEYTDRSIENIQSEAPYVIDRFDLFPTLHVSKQFPNDHQVLLSYGRRIDRPGGRELDPFVSYFDPYNIRQGNPGLEPEYIDSYELAYQKRLKNAFISLETYYRINKNKITRIKTLQDDGVILHTYQNLNKDFSLGAELMLNADFTKWFNFNGSVNVFDYRLEGSVEDEDVSASSTNWDGRMNLTFKIRGGFRTQITGIYRGATVTAQGEREGFFMTNVAVRKDFFDGRFMTTVSVRDLFATGKRETITRGTGFYSWDYFEREAPIITLNLSYIINNYKRQRDGNMEGGNGGDADMDIGM
jgi:outer membrane receptor protein involved in Fe transport